MAKSKYDELKAAYDAAQEAYDIVVESCDTAKFSSAHRERERTWLELQHAVHLAAEWVGLERPLDRTRTTFEQMRTLVEKQGLLNDQRIRLLYDLARKRLEEAEKTLVVWGEGNDNRQVSAEDLLKESLDASLQANRLIVGQR